MNCLNYYEAYAFCIWDGGRLPTEAEWHFAARAVRKSALTRGPCRPNASIDRSYAVYDTSPFLDQVGSRSPKGDGRWGNADLAGNALEWVRDWVSARSAGIQPPATIASRSTTSGPWRREGAS